MKRPYKLTPNEIEILKLGESDPNIVTDYWFRPTGTDVGWKFDQNFDPEGAWQKTVCMAAQTDIIVIGGFASGKTGGIGMAACYWGLELPWFKFLNVAEVTKQAQQMYDYILMASYGTPFARLIWEKPRRPYPKIVLKYQIGEAIYESSMEFMSVDEDATGILSWEGDWINIEEAGLLDNLEEIVVSVGSRLRGSVRGRPRLARLSMISNSWENTYLWYYFDQADTEPDDYLSMVVATHHNHNVTPKQLAKMLKRVPEDERPRWFEGTRPEGKGKYFNKQKIYDCENQLIGEFITQKAQEGAEGYLVEGLHGAGVVGFMTPPKKEAIYIELGDPGTLAAPSRDSPVVMIWEVPPDFPANSAKLACLWWGNGHGAISPWVYRLLELRELYNPVFCGVDSTGPQKNMAEMINVQYLGLTEQPESDTPTLGVAGLDFSGTKKSGYLVVARMFIESALLTWPKFVIGLRAQLSNYDPIKDKKLAQDLVAGVAMSAWAMRGLFNVDLNNLKGENQADEVEDDDLWLKRHSDDIRSRRVAGRSVQQE